MESYGGYLGLLKWTLAHSDGTAPSEVSKMSEEDQEWLAKVMESITVDVAKRMGAIGETLMKPDTEELVAEKEAVLEELIDLVDNLDNARDMCVLGGLGPLGRMLQSPHKTLQALAAEVAAMAAQNNPKVQEIALGNGLLDTVLPMAKDASSPDVQPKAVLALSCLVRDYPPSTVWFLENGGLDLLKTLLGHPTARLQRRSLVLLRHMLHDPVSSAAIASELATEDPPTTLQAVAAFTSSEDVDLRENSWHVFREFMLSGDTTAAAPAAPAAPPTVTFHTEPAGAPASGAGTSRAGAGAEAPPAPVVAAPAAPLPPKPARKAVLEGLSTPVSSLAGDRLAVVEVFTGEAAGDVADERASLEALLEVLAAVK